MFELIRSRLREERGFTLIELLVVMIIIAILMAVAVPVFLGQKQKALATNAKTNAKNIADVIESCGASTTNGTLQDSNGTQCATQAMIEQQEPSLAKLFLGNSCGGSACITVAAQGADGYTITSKTNGGTANDQATFTWTRTATNVSKTCGRTTEIEKRVCPPSGLWG